MLSDKDVEDLREAGVKPKLKDRVALDPMNYEARQLASNLIPNYRADGTGLIKVDFHAFRFISRLFQHKDKRYNLLKLKALYDEINKPVREKHSKEPPVQ